MITSRLEFVVLVLTIIALAGGYSAFLPGGQYAYGPQMAVEDISEAGDATKQALFILVYALNAALLLRFVRPRAWCFIGLPLFTLLLWCFASTTWSMLPEGTNRRVVAVAGSVLVGLYAGLRFDERRLTAALQLAAMLMVIGSGLWAVAFKSYGFDLDGYMRGLFFHKDAFGEFLGLSILVVMYRLSVLRAPLRPGLLLLTGLIICFILAGSATPIVALAGTAVTFCLTSLRQRSNGIVQSVAPLLICGALAAAIFIGADLTGTLAEVLGRKSDLSGRIPIWNFVIPMIWERPWLGYGYGIFWLGDRAPGALFWYWSKQFELHAHDGYLQLILDAGFVGLALFGVSLVMLIIRSAQLGGSGATSLNRFVSMLISYILIINISDTSFWDGNSLITGLYVWAVVRINLETWRYSVLTPVFIEARI